MEKHLILSLLSILLLSTTLNSQIINEFSSANNSFKNIKGKSYDWIEIYNNTLSDINLLNYSLTDDLTNPRKWLFPSIVLKTNEYVLIWASGKNFPLPNGQLQTNFKIKSKGEAIYFLSSMGEVIDKTPNLELNTNYSLGRIPSDFKNWYYFNLPTPMKPNDTKALKEFVSPPRIITQSGFYSENVEIKVLRENPHDKVYYTIDGSIPNQSSNIYKDDLFLNRSAILRFKAFRIDAVSSKTVSGSFFINSESELSVVSMITESKNFWGISGIYTDPYTNQEVPVHVEYFTKDKKLAFSQDVGVKIHSPDSRRQKSMRLYARDKYGKNKIKYRIFKDKNIQSFKRLVLRNGGNDGLEKGKTQIRDVFTHKLYQMQNEENAISSFEFVEVYINGKYWGIYNLRERQDEHYMEDNFGYEEDEVDFLEYDYQESHYKKTISGDWKDWESLKDFIINNDLSNEENYKRIEEWIDIDNFVDYQIFEIFIGNQDWENNNIKFWCPKKNKGKWKWILWDTDYALGTQRQYPVGKPDHNFIHMALTYGGWGNGDYTWMLRNLMKNESFKQRFITRYQDLLNTTFTPNLTNFVFNSLKNEIEPVIERQFKKWGKSRIIWKNDIEYTLNFLNERPQFCRKNLADEFEIENKLYEVEVDAIEKKGGMIKLNSLLINDKTLGWMDKSIPWKGSYFENQEIFIIAIPKLGYRFDHWEGDIETDDIFKDTLSFNLKDHISLQAIFMKKSVKIPNLLINEIMSSNKSAFEDGNGDFNDWIEIFNPSEEKIDLAGLYLTDDLSKRDKYKIPYGFSSITTIEPKGYLMIIADEKESDDDYLHTNFKLKKSGEEVGLFFKNINHSIVIDTVSFPKLEKDQSFGRLPEIGNDWVVFPISTPNEKNELTFPDFVEEQVSLSHLSVYPNPFNGYINIDYEAESSNTIFDLLILDIHGRVILKDKIRNNTTVNLSGYKRGAYFIKLIDTSSSKVIISKIIKNN